MNSSSKFWTSVRRFDSTDRNVWKYVFDQKDAVAEAVLYRYPEFKNRTVICCSTQSGCPVGCRFCGSGDYFNRSLSSAEIVEQITYVLEDHAIDAKHVDKLQFMFMSMGEPLLNPMALKYALLMLHEEHKNADLLVSTMGPDVGDQTWRMFRDLSRGVPKIGLQFSIHDSLDERRDKLIPFKKKLSLRQITLEGTAWNIATQRQPFANYCATPENTTDDDIRRLWQMFDPAIWQFTVSVVCEREEHVSAANKRQRQLAQDFMSKLLDKGYSVRMFDPAGQDDIGGGCGQLWFVQDWMKKHPDLARPSAGKSLPVLHAPK